MPDNADVMVTGAPQRSRYEAYVGGQPAGWSECTLTSEMLVLTHTEVQPAFEGRGVGGALDRVPRSTDRANPARCRSSPVLARSTSVQTVAPATAGGEDVPDQGEPQTQATPDVDEGVMGLLHDHVPLTLLVDLVDAPASEQVLIEEGIPDEPWWESSASHGGRDHQTAPEA